MVPIFFGLKIYKPVSFLFPFVSDDGNGSETKESKYKIGLKIFNPPQKLELQRILYLLPIY